MGKEVVVSKVLTPEMIAAGRELITALDKANVISQAALWIYVPELTLWRFLIAFPGVRSRGPKLFYTLIQSTLATLPDDTPRIRLQDISVLDPEDAPISVLLSTMDTGFEITETRISDSTFYGVFIEDVLIYRLAHETPPVPKSTSAGSKAKKKQPSKKRHISAS